jgi:hypothetical protein
MPSLGKTIFKGKSGNVYRFRVYPLNTRFRKISGVYVIGSRECTSGSNRVVALYVGHTEDFSRPLDKHLKAKDFVEQGANCICVQSDAVEESRSTKEQDLIAALQPACNN